MYAMQWHFLFRGWYLLIRYGLEVMIILIYYFRKVNMLAREYADKASDVYKPIIMSHHMMMGLLEG